MQKRRGMSRAKYRGLLTHPSHQQELFRHGKQLHFSPLSDSMQSSRVHCAGRAIAEPVGQTLGIPAIVVPDLQEINFGDWEGHTLNEVEVLYPDTFAAWN